MRIPWGDSDTLYVFEIYSKHKSQIIAVASTNDFYENRNDCKKMTYKEFKEKYPISSVYIHTRYKKLETTI